MHIPRPDLDLPQDKVETKFTSSSLMTDLPLLKNPNAKTTLNMRLFYLHSSCMYPDILFKTLTNSSDLGGKKKKKKKRIPRFS